MTVGIMQPYFLPYIGYFQLIKGVDVFVIYDNIEYTKKGWINRNRFLQGSKDAYFTIQLKKDSDFLDIKDRYISASFDKTKMINQIKEAYKKAPFFDNVFPWFVSIVEKDELNLFEFIYDSILKVCEKLSIQTKIIKSSSLEIEHSLKSEDKVIDICKKLKADVYINPIGGVELYKKDRFFKNNIQLKFLKVNNFEYNQFNNEFIPFLSILDIMMFNSEEEIDKLLINYTLV